jgi:hypothetical protein
MEPPESTRTKAGLKELEDFLDETSLQQFDFGDPRVPSRFALAAAIW